jgi:putative thioredoxin
MFGVRSIPFCVMFKDGQPVDGFVGAIPAEKIREFLDKHVPGADEAEAASEEAAAQEALAEGDTQGALEKLQHAVATDPANDDARFDYVKLLLQEGREDDAKVAFAPVIAKTTLVRRFDALQRWMAPSISRHLCRAPHRRSPSSTRRSPPTSATSRPASPAPAC